MITWRPDGRAWIALAVAALLTAGGVAHADEPPPGPADDPEASAAELDGAYRRLTRRGRPHHLRTIIEELAVVGGGAAWYWIDRDRQVADWDNPSLEQRITLEAWRFDNNPFPINYAWHAIDGGQYHVFARSNELSLLASMGYGLGTSFAWEWGLEFKEKVSINDMITTTGAGTAVGEFFHWLGRYFESAPDPRWWHEPVRWVLTTTRAAHNAIDGRDGLRAGTRPDALGLSSDLWHRFELSSGVSRAVLGGDAAAAAGADGLSLAGFTARGELAALPGYLRARRMSRRFADGNVSAAQVTVTGGDGAIGFDFAAEVMLLGYHHQELPAEGPGSATTVGLSLAYHYRRELFGDWVERLAQMHLPGLAVDQHVRAGDVAVRLRGRVHPDFAGIHAAAYPRWKELHPQAMEKTILRKHGYYYGWGLSASLDAEAAWRRVTVGGSLAFGRYDSQEGLDRTQEDVTDDVDAADRAFEWQTWLRVAPWQGRFYVEARISDEDRVGHVGEVESRQSLRRYGIVIGAAL